MTITNEQKTLDYYLGLKYPITFEEAPEGGYFVQIEDLPGCFAQGETLTEAGEMIDIARKMWLEVAFEDVQNIPMPREEGSYSGKFNVRVPRSLHRKLDQLADREGVSLNHILVSTLSHALGVEEGRQAKPRKVKA